MKFCWTTLQVLDLEESLKFYTEIIGLAISRRFHAGPGTEIAFLGEGDTLIELIRNENKGEVNLGTDISLGFYVDSLEEKMHFLSEHKVPIHSGPFQPNPHTRFLYVMDPNGLKIQFVEEM